MKALIKVRFVRWACFVTTCALLSGCATERNYALAVHSWINKPINKLLPVWGYPNKIMKLTNGHKLYVYRSHHHVRNPVTTIPGYTSIQSQAGRTTIYSSPPVVTGGGSYNLRCDTWFEINRHAVIVNARFRGNNCVARQQFIQSYGVGHKKNKSMDNN